MATTTYYAIALPDEDEQDWGVLFNRALGRLTELLLRNQRPGALTIRWGDEAGLHYVESAPAAPIKVVGGLDVALGTLRNVAVEEGADFPASFVVNQLFVRAGVLYRRTAAGWEAFGPVDAAAVSGAGGILVGDLGGDATDKGSFPVYLAGGGLGVVRPQDAPDGHALVADSGEATGWRLVLIPAQFAAGAFGAKGDLFAGSGVGTGVAVAVGADDSVLQADASQPGGFNWRAVLAATARMFMGKGEILAGTGAQVGALVPAPVTDQVLLGDATAPTGMRWAPQSDMGSIPGAQTNAFANAYAVQNYV